MDIKVEPRKSFRTRVAEMIGRVQPIDEFLQSVSTSYSLYRTTPTIDRSKVNYALTRAIYLASVKEQDGKAYGRDFLYGAVFAKPIVNSTAAFAVGDMPNITFETEEDPDNEIETALNGYLDEDRGIIFDWFKYGFNDGDGYIEFVDGVPRILDPACVEEIVDLRTGKLEGFDLKFKIEEADTTGKMHTNIYVRQIRSDHEDMFLLDSNGNLTPVDGQRVDYDADTPFRVIAFHNEPDPMAIYGNCEYQSSLNLMIKYHKIFDSGTKNVEYNANAIPVFEGIDDMTQFLESNGEKGEDGNYVLKWNPEKIILGGTNFNAKFLESANTSGAMTSTLNIIFWCICQTSETPEFLFGTAVQSSNASVDSQLPIVAKKAARKQAQLERPLRALIDFYLWFHKDDLTGVTPDIKYKIEFSSVINDDLTLNLAIANQLLTLGVITKETAAKLCKIDNWVENITEEVKKADGEAQVKTDAANKALADALAVSQKGRAGNIIDNLDKNGQPITTVMPKNVVKNMPKNMVIDSSKKTVAPVKKNAPVK